MNINNKTWLRNQQLKRENVTQRGQYFHDYVLSASETMNTNFTIIQ